MKFRLLNADEIDVRVSVVRANGCSVLLYKDARVDMNILDETVGPTNWQRAHELIDGQLFCNVGIWVERRGDGFGDWVWKQDVGTESYTEKEKGRASDSFKRACFNWGIGRELYTAPFIWISSTQTKIEKRDNGSYNVRDRFYVDEIGYDEQNRINMLVIKNGGGNVVYSLGKTDDVTTELITEAQAVVLLNTIKSKKTINQVLKRYDIKSFAELTKVQYAEVIEAIKKLEEQKRKTEELKEKADAEQGETA